MHHSTKCAFLISLLFLSFTQSEITICAKHECPQEINRFCHPVEDTIECLKKINKNDITIGLAMPDEALLASSFYPNIKIVAKVMPGSEVKSNWQHQLVVVTNREITKVHDMQNFKYYHIGLENLKLKRYIPNLFEGMIIQNYTATTCEHALTLAEKEVCTLNEFFGASCRGGTWVDHHEQQFAFAKTYPKLTEKCSRDATTLEVLDQDDGVIAITTLELFNASKNSTGYLLWKNGLTSKMNDSFTQSWYQQAWPLILTHKNNEVIGVTLNLWFGDCQIFPSTENLNDDANINNDENTNDDGNVNDGAVDLGSRSNFDKLKDPDCTNARGVLLLPKPNKVYIKYNQLEDVPKWYSKEFPSGVKPLKWCTVSKEETIKCEWMKLLAGNLAYPIDCIQLAEKADCYRAIEDYHADIIAAKNPPSLGALKEIATIEYLSKEGPEANVTTIPESCPRRPKLVLCYKVLMRTDDPNIANAKVLLASLKRFFVDEKETRLFDLFGNFMGNNVLFESYTADMDGFSLNLKVMDDRKVDSASTSTAECNGASNQNIIRFLCICSIVYAVFS